MMKKKKYTVMSIIILFLCCLCMPMAGETVNGEASQKTISITEFYNNGQFGDAYSKARRGGAVVTISNAEEMRIFFKCLYDFDWTYGISFRQEKDIAFSNCTFDYNPDSNRIFVNRGGVNREHYGVCLPMETVELFGLEDACFELGAGRDFWGQYDGQGYSISGFIASNGGLSVNGGIFGHIRDRASIRRVKIRDCFLNLAWGALCGENLGLIEDCSVESVVGSSWSLGGIAYSNGGTIRCCRVDRVKLCSAWGYGYFGGIAAASYSGEISDCAVEHLQIKMVWRNLLDSDNNITKIGLSAGGIAGYQRGGQIVNCSSFYEALCTSTGQEKTGGIVGSLEDGNEGGFIDKVEYVHSEISNCISAGQLHGKTAGGIVGKICLTESASHVLLKNNLSLIGVHGDVAGGIVGQLDAGKVTACYSYDKSGTLDIAGEKNSGNVAECYAVNQAQVYGEPSANVIDANSTYSNTKTLLTALNSGTSDNSDYLKWKAGVLGYPVLISNLNEAPVGDYELGSEIKVSLPYQPENTTKPEVTATPESTISPSPSAAPDASVSPSPDVPLDNSASPLPDVTAPPSNQENENKKSLIKNLAVKNLKVQVDTSLHVGLSWKRNQWADGYQILRSAKSSSGYKVVGKASASKTGYVDKTAKRGHIYFYMVRGYVKNAGSTVYGNGQKKKIRMAWYQAPLLRLSAGKTSSGKSYVQIGISRYSGSYIEVYFKANGKNYIKAPLKSEKVAFYNGKLRFSYRTKSLLYCRVRTYEIKRGKKQYSAFSKEKKIRL